MTYAIIGICFLVWFGELGSATFFDDVVLTPRLGDLQPWRFITSAFAHSTSILHIGFNMFALWTLRFLEPLFGRAKFAAIYLVSAIGGGVVFVALSSSQTDAWDTGVVGASGAIFGLFGALLPLFRKLRQSTTQIWVVLAINAAITFTVPDIAWQAHVGGFLTGVVAGVLVVRERDHGLRGQRDRSWTYLFLLLLVIVLIGGVKYAMV